MICFYHAKNTWQVQMFSRVMGYFWFDIFPFEARRYAFMGYKIGVKA